VTEPGDDIPDGLLHRLHRRDEAAFRELVGRYQGVVRAYATGILGDPDEAEDAAQECFIRAYRRVGAFRGDASLQTWLLRICRNHCLDRLRARPSVQLVELREDLAEGATDTTEAGVAIRVDRERLVTALAILPEPLQQTVVLRELRGLSYDEVAGALDVPVGTVRSRLSTARELLRASLRAS
jgi:RNA polymerase sigma-70 factor (ECF subfamily)